MCGGRRGRGDGDWRCHGERRRGLPCRKERVMRPSSACSRKGACGSRISGGARCRGSASTHPWSVSRRRVRPRESLCRRWCGRRPRASMSSTATSVSEDNARSGARALRAARSPSTGASCSRPSRCSTMWSCMSSVTCASRTTRDDSGRSSSNIAHTGVNSATGYATTDRSSWRSALRPDFQARRLATACAAPPSRWAADRPCARAGCSRRPGCRWGLARGRTPSCFPAIPR